MTGAPQDSVETRGEKPRRYPLLSTWRWVVPAAIVAGLLGALTLGGWPRWLCGAGAIVLALLWVLGRVAQPAILLDDEGYRVEERGREKLRVRFTEVRRARAVPSERAMYVDCGEPARNLLLPPRRGYGFRFADQEDLYVRLARALGDKLEIVPKLES